MRLMSHSLLKEARSSWALPIIKNSGQQINYGTGGDVSDESIARSRPAGDRVVRE